MRSTLSTGFIIAALAVLSCAFVPAERIQSAGRADSALHLAQVLRRRLVRVEMLQLKVPRDLPHTL